MCFGHVNKTSCEEIILFHIVCVAARVCACVRKFGHAIIQDLHKCVEVVACWYLAHVFVAHDTHVRDT
jgi:hypothetical protein